MHNQDISQALNGCKFRPLEELPQESSKQSQEEVYNPKQASTRKSKSIKKKLKQKPNGNSFNASLWTLKENRAYKQFLRANEDLFGRGREQKKIMKINVLMSRAVGTRSADQCRSHHQKMVKYHGSIGQIIQYIQTLGQDKRTAEDVQNLCINPLEEGLAELLDFDQLSVLLRFEHQDKDVYEQLL